MNDIIEFPNNADNYYRKALNELNARHFDRAEILLLKSLELEFATDVFLELVHLYLSLRQKEKLEELWEAYYPNAESRLEYEPIAQHYALSISTIFPLTKALIELYRLRDYFIQQEWNTLPIQSEIEQLNQHQVLEEALADAIAREQVLSFLDELYAAGAYALLEQLKHLYTLPYEKCAPLYRAILVHSQVEQYIKSDVLHYLITQQIDETLPLIWFDESHELSTGSLRPYHAQTQFLATVRAIQIYCEQQNPHLYDDLIQQLTLQAMCFYPFINEVLHQPDAWITCMTDDNIPDSPLTDKIMLASNELFRLLDGKID